MEYKDYTLPQIQEEQNIRAIIDSYLLNFKGGNRIQRGGGWTLKGGGADTSTFLASSIGYSLIPTTTNSYTLGSAALKWSDIRTVLINGVAPKSGTATYYVAASSGGSPTTAIVFNTGILT